MRIDNTLALDSGPVARRLLRVAAAVALGAGFAAAAGAQLEPTQLSDLMATGGLIENVQTVADGAFTLYTADAIRKNRPELWSLDNSDGTVRKLNVELEPAEQVWGFWPSPSGDRVVYLVLAPPPDRFRGYFVVDVAGGPSVPISGTLPPAPEVLDEVRWTADGGRVVYGHRLVTGGPVHLLSSTAEGAPPVDISGPIVDDGDVNGFDVAGDAVVFWGTIQDPDQRRAYSVMAAGGPRIELSAALPPDASVRIARILQPAGARPLAILVSKEASDELYTVPMAGGPLTQLPKAQPFRLSFDHGEPLRFVPGANRIVYATSWERVLSQSLDGGAPVDMGSNSDPHEILQWGLTSDQARVLVLERDNSVSTLYSTPIDGGTPLKISSDQPSGTRIQHFAVGPDPDRFVYLADDRMQNRTELFVSSTTAVDATRLSPLDFAGRSGIFHLNYFITADGSRVVYIADQLELGVHELFSVPLDGGLSTRLSQPLPYDADIWRVYRGLDAGHVFYTGAQLLLSLVELFEVDVLGAAEPEKVSAPLMARLGEIDSFKPTPDGARVVYLADQRFFERSEVWSVPSEGGVPVRLSPDLVGDDVISGFTLDPSSRWVAMSINGSPWISPVDASAPPEEITLSVGQLSATLEFTPDGQHLIARGLDLSFRSTLFRVPTEGGPVVELLPPDLTVASVESGGRTFRLTPDGERVVFTAKEVTHSDFAANRIYSVPATGGEPILLSSFPLSRALSLTLSADGSYAVFAGRPSGESASAIYGSPTDLANTVELVPPINNLFNFYPHVLDGDGSHLAYLFRDDVWVVETETGVVRNLTEDNPGEALEMQFVNGGESLLVQSTLSSRRELDVYDIDGVGVTPQTSAFPAQTLYEYHVDGETLIMLVDPDDADPAARPLLFTRPLAAPPGAGRIMSDPLQRAFPPIRVSDDFVSYVSAGRVAYAADRNGGAPILLRPAADAIRDTLLEAGRYFYVATEPNNELPELYVIDVAGAVIVFRDGFESGDTARWSSTAESSESAAP